MNKFVSFFLAIFVGFFICVTSIANASMPARCIDVFRGHEFIFTGKAISFEESKTPYGGYKYTVDFRIDKIYKGANWNTIKVNTYLKPNLNVSQLYYVGYTERGFYSHLSKGGCGNGKETPLGYLEYYDRAKLHFDIKLLAQRHNIWALKAKILQSMQVNDFFRAIETYEDLLAAYKMKGVIISPEAQKTILDYAYLLRNLHDCKGALRVLHNYFGADDAATILKLECTKKLELSLPDISEKLNMKERLIKDVVFENQNLSHSSFEGIVFDNVTFKNVILQESVFLKARGNINFIDSDLSRATIKNSNLSITANNSDFRGVSFEDTTIRVSERSMQGNDFTDANFENGSIQGKSKDIFKNVNLSNAKISAHKSSLEQAKILAGVTIRNVYYSYTDKKPSTYKNRNLRNISIHSSNFSDISFEGSDMEEANISSSKLKGASFKNVNLKYASFSGVDLSGADLTGAILGGVEWNSVRYSCSTKYPEGFRLEGRNNVMHTGFCNMPASKSQINNFVRAGRRKGNNTFKYASATYDFQDGDISKYDFSDLVNEHTPRSETRQLAHSYFRLTNIKAHYTNFQHMHGSIEASNTDFQGADFRNATLNFSNLTDVSFKDAKFKCAYIDIALDGSVDIGGAKLAGAISKHDFKDDSKKEDLAFNPLERKILFRNMDKAIELYGVTNYTNMDFKGCDLSNIDFGTLDLSGGDFSDAILNRTDFSDAKVDGAIFPDGFDPNLRPNIRILIPRWQ